MDNKAMTACMSAVVAKYLASFYNHIDHTDSSSNAVKSIRLNKPANAQCISWASQKQHTAGLMPIVTTHKFSDQ